MSTISDLKVDSKIADAVYCKPTQKRRFTDEYKNEEYGLLWAVHGADRGGGVYQGAGSGGAVHASVSVYDAGGAAAGREAWGDCRAGVYAAGTCGASDLYRGRRTLVSSEAELRLHHRLRARYLCDRSHRGDDAEEDDPALPARESRGARDRLCLWHELLLCDL